MPSNMSAISETNNLTLRDLQAVAPTLLMTRNAKGRPIPVHLRSAPGVGKTMIARRIAIAEAMANPNVPFGFVTHNVSNGTPADIAGYTIFADQTFQGVQMVPDPANPSDPSAMIPQAVKYTDRVSRYTVPALFSFGEVFLYESREGAEPRLLRFTHDDFGQPIYVGSTVAGRPVLHGLILLDEFAQADSENRKACAPFLDEGRVGTHYLPPGVAVWAASNRLSDKSGVGRAMAFLTNRECAINIKPDYDALYAYAEGLADDIQPEPVLPLAPISDRGRANGRKGWHPVVMAFLRGASDVVFAGVPDDPAQPYVTPRSLEAVANLFDAMMVHESSDAPVRPNSGDPADSYRSRIFEALCAGLIGSSYASTLMTTLSLFEEVPEVADVVADPDKARVSDKRDAQMIASYIMSRAMTPANGEALCRYLRRMSGGSTGIFYKNAVINAMARDGSLLSLPSVAALIQSDSSAITRMFTAKANAQRVDMQRERAGLRRRS